MLFRITLLTLLTVLAVAASPVSPSFGTLLGWNDLLNCKGIFDQEIDSIQTKSKNDGIILGQLTDLLNQDRVLQRVYSNYQKSFSKDVTDTFTQDGSSRIEFFKSKLIGIATHNLEARNEKHSWVQGVNQFTDRTDNELDARYSINVDSIVDLSLENDSFTFPPDPLPYFSEAPESLDWRDFYVVTSVKDQGHCNSCAMFASTGALESVNALRKDTIYPQSLSPQELVDCAVPEFTCPESPGSYPWNSFDYLQNTGASTLKSYPYNSQKPKKGICQMMKEHVARIGDYLFGYNIPEDELKDRVAAYGPVYAAIRSNRTYAGGVMTWEACGDAPSNHAVLIVGYGTTEKGVQYWLIKNSYGSEKWSPRTGGYLYLARNAGFACQISKSRTFSITKVA